MPELVESSAKPIRSVMVFLIWFMYVHVVGVGKGLQDSMK